MECCTTEIHSSVCHHFLIMSLDQYFYFISSPYLSNSLNILMILCRITQQVNMDVTCRNDTAFYFLIISPDPYLYFAHGI